MNEQDSAQMQSLLKNKNFVSCFDQHDADVILLNTCSIREKAVQKLYSDLGRIRPLKDDHQNLIVAVAGCVAEQEKLNISKRFPFVELIFGPDHIRHLPDMIDEILQRRSEGYRETVHRTGFDKRQDFEFVNVLPASEETQVKAFVNIQKGCDNICSFCIVPFVRGREVSRPHQEIIDEINQLVDRGVREVTLLGQNVNSYGLKTTGGLTFAQLLDQIAVKTKLQRLRFTTSHPKDVKDDLIDQYVNNPILMPQFQLPVQSGSDRILKLMNRQYTSADYLYIIDQLRAKVPDIRFSTDIIVGFPTETDEDFQKTLDMMKYVRYDHTYSFIYSTRPYTRAAVMEDDIPLSVKQTRLKALQNLDNELTSEINRLELNQIREVLVDEIDRDEGVVFANKGRTRNNKIVHFSGDVQLGDLAHVKVTRANSHSLYGELVGHSPLISLSA